MNTLHENQQTLKRDMEKDSTLVTPSMRTLHFEKFGMYSEDKVILAWHNSQLKEHPTSKAYQEAVEEEFKIGDYIEVNGVGGKYNATVSYVHEDTLTLDDGTGICFANQATKIKKQWYEDESNFPALVHNGTSIQLAQHYDCGLICYDNSTNPLHNYKDDVRLATKEEVQSLYFDGKE